MQRKAFGKLAGLTLGLGLVLALGSPQCHADLLQFGFEPNGPIITGIAGNLTYSAATGNFHSTAVAITYAPAPAPGGAAFFSPGSRITIDLFVDTSGAFKNNGTGITITGSLDLDGDGTPDVSSVLLAGAITAFGAQPASPPTWTADGLFTVQGGALTQNNIPLSGGGSTSGGFSIGEIGGFILFAENVTSGNLGDFNQSFSSNSVKTQLGPVAVPEPPAWVTCLTGAAMLAVLGCLAGRWRTGALA
jgi:hypothetical protein